VTNILLDITSDESIEKARSDVESRFSKLDVLVVSPVRTCTTPYTFIELCFRTMPALPTFLTNWKTCPHARSSPSHTIQMSSALPA
jgi:hypothetical protein